MEMVGPEYLLEDFLEDALARGVAAGFDLGFGRRVIFGMFRVY
ncbi:MAG: hypothetical protein WA820_06120 [Bradyrhizobium sp.]|jgi:hypothetical protein